jgi:thiamine biosynthesis lipoprotein
MQLLTASLLVSCSNRRNVFERIDHFWSGIGFGIPMSAELYQIDEALIQELDFESLIQEFESAFSLYSDSSELSILNRERELVQPSPLFRELLRNSVKLSKRTYGYYQPAIHAAWTAMEEGELTQELLDAVSLQNLRIDSDRVTLTHPLTELSFNAVVQGFLTDRVSEYLRQRGVSSALLHFGETYGIGEHPDDRPWSLAVMGTPTGEEVDLVGTMEFADAGLAVSTHDRTRKLLNPISGDTSLENRVVAVVSKEGATAADAFATAFTVAPENMWQKLYAELTREQRGAVKIWVENELAFEEGL